ncbi:MAG: ABC transporter substrate-binding protein [Deltaproteobacteria bacterium]|nr:ABC transporter substrate-binding protein [Deltaproteobacteria bacterium]
MAYPQAPKSLDPHRYPPDPAAWPAVMIAYKRLFDLKPGSSDLDNTSSAASTYRVSDDGTIYTILLQEGQSFSDGTPVDSMAALFSFDRLMATETGRVYFPPLRFLEIVGPYTFRLHLDKPWPPFIAALTTPMASLVSPSAAQKPAGFLDKSSLGSGRFEVESFEDQKLVLRIRPDAPSVPKLNRVEILFEPDPLKRSLLVNSGRAHLAWEAGRPQEISDFAEWRLVPTFETRFLAFNMTRPYLRMDSVREALAALALACLGQDKPFRPAGFFPAGLAPDLAQAAAPDPAALMERAGSILAAVGPSRTPLDLAYHESDPQGRADAETLAGAMRGLGLSARPVPLSGAHGQAILEKADWDLLLDNRRPQLPGPEMWLGGFLDSKSSVVSNPARYDDSEADSLISEMGASDRQEKARVVRRLSHLALDKRPYVMIYQKPLALLVDKRLSKLAPHPMWPEVWPVEATSLDPFRPAAPASLPAEPQGPLIPGFDNPVAEPWE